MVRLAIAVASLVLVALPVLAKTPVGTQHGIASVYARKFIGHRTASGEVLDRTSLTAAHPRLPFGTRLEVTNRHNGRSIIVTVNDRGPHRKGRIIDLSPAAAEQLGLHDGLMPVEIRVALR